MKNSFRIFLLVIFALIIFTVISIYYRSFVKRDFLLIDTTNNKEGVLFDEKFVDESGVILEKSGIN